MTRAADCLAQVLKRLHAIEDDLEHENALNPDLRLTNAEIVLHKAITDLTAASKPIPAVTRRCCCGDISGPACFDCPI